MKRPTLALLVAISGLGCPLPAGAQSLWVQIDNVFVNESNIYSNLRSWLGELKAASKTNFSHYVGISRAERVGPYQGLRILIIYPSEYVRDSALDWDSCELVIGHLAPMSAPNPGPVWVSTENYRRRVKGLLAAQQPDPDWEFAAAADNETANARLRDIADAVKRVAESHRQTILPPPARQ